MSDPQDRAEALDEDVVDIVDDITGDEYGEGLPTYPPDRPLGVDPAGEWREDPDPAYEAVPDEGVGQLVEPDVSTEDHEEQQIADIEPGTGRSAEEAAIHIEPD